MTVDLNNQQGNHINITNIGWSKVLTLACYYGWQPAGTLPPASWDEAEEPWDPLDYSFHNHQTVTKEDALAIADALARAYENMPEVGEIPRPFIAKKSQEALGHVMAWGESLRVLSDVLESENLTVPPEILTSVSKKTVARLITYLWEGSFTIS